jgi:amino acid adenylation domain-containing protein
MATLLEPNFATLLWSTTRTHAASPAVVECGREFSYAAVCDRAASVAAALAATGLKPNDRVAILLENGMDAVAAFFGVLAAGGIAVVLNDVLRSRQIAHVLDDSGAALLLTSRERSADHGPDARRRVLSMDALPTVASFAPVRRLGADPAQIIYTSGSSGQPKGVTVAHANLWASAQVVTGYLGITQTDRIAALLPFSFVYGMSQVLCAVATGATLVIERSPLATRLVTELRTRRVTVLAAVPPLWLQLVALPEFRGDRLPDLRIMTNAGGRLPVAAVRALRGAQPHARLFLMYGLTEALRCSYLPPEEIDRHPDSIGRAIPGAEVLVLRDDLLPCAPGEVGELVYRGPTVALGYWNDPEATARVFRPNPLRATVAPDAERVVFTGDLVRQDDAGFLYYVGRRDRMMKTLGYRVSPDEVAEVIYASGEVADCLVVGEADELRGQRIVAHIVLAAGGSLQRLKRHCGIELPRYMQPARFDVHDDLPRLPNGKHDLSTIHATYAGPHGSHRVPG